MNTVVTVVDMFIISVWHLVIIPSNWMWVMQNVWCLLYTFRSRARCQVNSQYMWHVLKCPWWLRRYSVFLRSWLMPKVAAGHKSPTHMIMIIVAMWSLWVQYCIDHSVEWCSLLVSVMWHLLRMWQHLVHPPSEYFNCGQTCVDSIMSYRGQLTYTQNIIGSNTENTIPCPTLPTSGYLIRPCFIAEHTCIIYIYAWVLRQRYWCCDIGIGELIGINSDIPMCVLISGSVQWWISTNYVHIACSRIILVLSRTWEIYNQFWFWVVSEKYDTLPIHRIMSRSRVAQYYYWASV